MLLTTAHTPTANTNSPSNYINMKTKYNKLRQSTSSQHVHTTDTSTCIHIHVHVQVYTYKEVQTYTYNAMHIST